MGSSQQTPFVCWFTLSSISTAPAHNRRARPHCPSHPPPLGLRLPLAAAFKHGSRAGLRSFSLRLQDSQGLQAVDGRILHPELIPDTELLEFVCNENEKDLPHLVGK